MRRQHFATLTLLLAFAVPHAEAQIIRPRFQVAQPTAFVSFGMALQQGWSVDAQFTYSGERWADNRNTFKRPAVPQLNLGARRRFELAGRPAQLRVLASNVTGEEGYWASPSGFLWPISPRTVRAMLTLTFGPKG